MELLALNPSTRHIFCGWTRNSRSTALAITANSSPDKAQGKLCSSNAANGKVLNKVKQTVNYIRAKGRDHKQFKQFLQNLESEYEDVSYFAQVWWLV